MQIVKFKAASLTAIIILAGVISIYPGIALLTGNHIINSSGLISYFSTRPLHVEGRYIKDDQNQTVYLRGANVGGWVDDYCGLWTSEGRYYGQDIGQWIPSAVQGELDAMKSWGMTCVRSLMCVDWWQDNYMNYRDHYKDFVTWAGERGIYVLVGFWSLTHYEGGGWCACTPFPYPPYIPSEYAYLMPNEQAFIDFWGDVAYEFKDYPNVLFDLWNEVGHGLDPREQYQNEWWPVAQGCIDAIREYTQAPVIIDWGWGICYNLEYHGGELLDWVQTCPLTGGNLVFSTHVYRDGGGLGYWSSNNTRAYLKEDITEAWNGSLVRAVGEEWNKPLIIGEIGCNLAIERDQELIAFQNALEISNDWGLHYIAWIWISHDGPTNYYLMESGGYVPPPSAAGQVLIDALAAT